MKNLLLVITVLLFSSTVFANHWSLTCDFPAGNIEIRINNNKAKVIAPFGTTLLSYTSESEELKVYSDEEGTSLIAPNVNYVIGSIPMGAKDEFTLEKSGPTEALPLDCETRPTIFRDSDLN